MTEETNIEDTESQGQLIGRNADGTFAFGNTCGRGAKRLTWQKYADRIAYWRSFPVDHIEQMVNDPVALKKLVSRDVEIIKAICLSAVKDDRGERAYLINREIGGEISRNEHTGAEGADLFGATKSVRSRLLSETPSTGATETPSGGDGDGSSGS